MSLIIDVLGYGTLFLQLILVAGLIVFVTRRLGFSFESRFLDGVEGFLNQRSREIAFSLAAVATSGSLYMSQIMGWEPCLLCWYQRILIYPMVVVLGVGIVLQKEDVADYVIPLAMIGIPVAAYHYLVQRLDQFQSAGCSVLEVSCETAHTFYFGYISIPMMALTALVSILVILWRFRPRES